MRFLHPRHQDRPGGQQAGTALLTVCLLCSLGTGCGMVGSPLPPEDIGIEAKVRAQAEQRRSAQEGKRIAPIEESDIVLPPLQPIDTQ